MRKFTTLPPGVRLDEWPPDAAGAEALSTAFFVLGVEKAREYCHNHKEVAALLIPAPASGNRLEPVNCGIPETDLIFIPEN